MFTEAQLTAYSEKVVNPGGLYGNARPENFPNVNDYRNPILAEAMKVLGYVNRFNRGILNVQQELNENGNGNAIFDFDKMTVFGVTVYNAVKLLQHAQHGVTLGKTENVTENVTEKRTQALLHLIAANKQITAETAAERLQVTKRTILRDIDQLRQKGHLKRIGPAKGGHWEIIK